MSEKYSLRINQSENKLPVVEVIEHFDEYINTFADLATHSIIDDMVNWCEENQNGWRTSYNTFKFRNDEQLLIFLLTWSPKA